MLSRLLLCVSLAVLAHGAAARLQPRSTPEFQAQGLELLQGRYGVAYPGYAGLGDSGFGVGATDQLNLGVNNLNNFGMSNFAVNPALTPALGVGLAAQYPIAQAATGISPFGLAAAAAAPSVLGLNQEMLGSSSVMPAYGAPLVTPALGAYGGVGAMGAALGSSKKTTVAQPIYAQSMVVPKIITQPILRPHAVTQPIVQQQLIQQPIVETRQVIQPVIRRIITQPIIRPEIYESTTIQPTLKTETIVQPHVIQQTVVTPTLQNQMEEAAPIQEAPRTQVQQPVVQPTISAKKSSGGLGMGMF